MSALAVVTLCVGPEFEKLAGVTHPTLRAYASRCDADFISIAKRTRADVPVGYEKMMLRELLAAYERVLFLDTDLIVRRDCPNLFELVPPGIFGVFNEGEFVDRRSVLAEGAQQFNMPIIDTATWGTRYYNTGVMVFDRAHRDLFVWPEVCHDNYFEQTYINLMLNRAIGVNAIQNLDYRFNRMAFMDAITRADRLDCYIVHYAGTATGSGWCDLLSNFQSLDDFVRADLQRWTGGLL